MRLDGSHECSKVEVETAGDPVDVDERDIAFAALDVTHVRAIDPRELREALLRDPALEAQPTDGVTERDQKLRCVDSHDATLGSPPTMGPPAMSGP
jgi:hypothetical protein